MAPTSPSQKVLTDRSYPRSRELLPTRTVTGGRYVARFAQSSEDLLAIQRLRFEVFNLELGEGLEESFATGLDQDIYDLGCHHLMVCIKATGEVVGTYRMQTRAMADAFHGLYTAGEFDLSTLPDEMLENSIETGRACVAKDHRNGRVLNMLWKGLAAYLIGSGKRYLFGCCSLTSQDPHVAKQTYELLSSGSFLHPTLETRPHPQFVCYEPGFEPDPNVTVKLPPLFAGYLRFGAKITGEPALDRDFKTIDFLTLFDIETMDERTLRAFFSDDSGG